MKAKKKFKWSRKWGTYHLEDGQYGYAHVYKCQNHGLSHGLWCAVGRRCTTHGTLAEAQTEIERQYSCRPPRPSRKSKLRSGAASRSKGRSKRVVGSDTAKTRRSPNRV